MATGGTAERGYRDLFPPEQVDALWVLHQLWLGLPAIRWIVPHDDRNAVPLFQGGARVLKLPVNHVGWPHQLARVSRLIAYRHNGVCTPVGHATKHAGQGGQGGDCLSALSEQSVQGESGLCATKPIRYQLITVPANLVQGPLVDPGEPCTDYWVCGQVVVAPRGVVGPSQLERAVPYPRVGSRDGVVVRRHLDDAQLHVIGARGHLVAK